MSEPVGVLLLDKPAGITSHGAVDRVRRILGTKRVGHTGTLDPQATGLLILCLGKATKIARFLVEEPKVYQADCWLGVTTDTLDMSGAVLREREVAAADDEIRAAFEDVHGRFDQMPPMVSALKHQGKPLYEYARAGTEIERKARPVEIYSLEVEEIAREAARTRVAFTVGCSRGTYIRSLCDDIGERLGSGGAMGALRRLSAGRFRADEAVSLEELEELQSQGRPPLLTPAEALADLPSVRVVPAALRAVLNGQQLKPAMILGRMDLPPEGECLSVLDPDGELIAIHMTAQAPAYVTKTLRVL